MTVGELFRDSLESGRKFLEDGLGLAAAASDEDLNRAPATGEWSPAQVYRHLVLSNDPYAMALEQALGRAGPGRSEDTFRPTLLGRAIAIGAGPGPNTPAPRKVRPPEGTLPRVVVDEWADGHRRVIELIERSEGVDWNARVFKSPLLPVFRMSIGDAIRIFTVHTDRHLRQVRDRLPPQ